MKFLRVFPLIMVGTLAIQYILGMLVNMYAEFPEGGGVTQNWEFARSNALILSHVLLGTLILLGAIAYLVVALAKKQRKLAIASGVALGAVLITWLGGEEFISTQNDAYSLVMAVGFLVDMAAYGVIRTLAQKLM